MRGFNCVERGKWQLNSLFMVNFYELVVVLKDSLRCTTEIRRAPLLTFNFDGKRTA